MASRAHFVRPPTGFRTGARGSDGRTICSSRDSRFTAASPEPEPAWIVEHRDAEESSLEMLFQLFDHFVDRLGVRGPPG
jgi:hypothetical protein